IEDLCAKRDELQRQILIEEEDKHKIEHDIRLSTRTEFDRKISETEAAYMKILESSQTLLNVLKRESHSLHTKIDE
ncbi:unnamed protein product, partial [Rotaria sp. Silwood2]